MGNSDLGCRFHPDAQLIEDYRSGDRICRECGLIVGGRAIDVGSEWRTVRTDRFNGDASRVGAAENPLLTGSDLSTTVAHDTTGVLPNKLLKKQSSATADRILVNAFNGISKTADRAHLSKSLIDRAKNIFTEVHEKPMLKPRSKEATATACLYVACRQENIPRTFKEICEAAQKSKKEIGRCYKLILRALNTSINAITVEDFMPRFCINLELPPEIQYTAGYIARSAVDMDLVPGRSPISVTAAAIYMASQASTVKKSQKEIAEVAGVAAATVRQTYKLMYPSAEELFPNNFKFETPIEELPLT